MLTLSMDSTASVVFNSKYGQLLYKNKKGEGLKNVQIPFVTETYSNLYHFFWNNKLVVHAINNSPENGFEVFFYFEELCKQDNQNQLTSYNEKYELFNHWLIGLTGFKLY